MSIDLQTDLEECEREPIHIPGAVQSHGAVIAVDPATGTITHVSENIQAFWNRKAAWFLSRNWSEVAGETGIGPDLTGIPEGPDSLEKTVEILNQPVHLRSHRYADRIIFEFHRDHDTTNTENGPLPDLSGLNVFAACQRTAESFAQITGYDRTMVYKFHEDYSGEVIAEVCPKGAVPYIGLRYPASDIPKQARELFLINRTRVIADVNSLNSTILAVPGERPLDCSCTFVRSVSPYHIAYLKNMGVYASLVCALSVNGKLWGLIAGHQHNPRQCSAIVRQRGEGLADRLSQRIGEIEKESRNSFQLRLEKESRKLQELYSDQLTDTDCIRSLIFGSSSLQSLFESNSAAVLTKTSMIASGDCPEENLIRKLIQKASETGLEVAEFNELPAEMSDSRHESFSGALLGKLQLPDGEVWLFCGRPEQTREVLWGGDPSKPVYRDAKLQLQPRDSFELWKSVVKGRCRPWSGLEKERMKNLLESLAGRKAFNSEKAEEAIHEFKEIYDRSPDYPYIDLYSTNDGVLLIAEEDQSGRLVWKAASRGAYKLLGIDPLIHDTVHPVEAMEAAGFNMEDLKKGKQRVECWHADQGLRIMQTSRQKVLTITGPALHTVYYSVSFLDVTLEERMLQAMQASRDHSVALKQTQDAFLSNLSHEMRNPLNAVIGLAELTGSSAGLSDEEREKYSKLIREAGVHMLEMVNSLLDLSKERTGRLGLENEQAVDLTEIARIAIQWLEPIASKKSVILHGPDEERLIVLCDRQKIRQVYVNLLANAIKFTNGPGNVYVRTGTDANGSPFFEVEDTGRGIPAADLPHIFDRFYRVVNRDVQGLEGAGLGLSISKAFIELHSGVIHVSSEPGSGTLIRCTFPPWRLRQGDGPA